MNATPFCSPLRSDVWSTAALALAQLRATSFHMEYTGTPRAPETQQCAIMLHDGDCPLCAMEVAHYRRQDTENRIAFVDVAGDTHKSAETLNALGLTRAQALGRLHVRTADGRLVSGARAFVEIWRALPGWRRLAPIAGAPPIIWILEGAYRAFLPLRPVLAGLVRRLRR